VEFTEFAQWFHEDTSGTLISVDYLKKDGSPRTITTRSDVTTGVTGRGMSWSPNERGYLPVLDFSLYSAACRAWLAENGEHSEGAIPQDVKESLAKKCWRMLTPATIQRIRFSGIEIDFTTESKPYAFAYFTSYGVAFRTETGFSGHEPFSAHNNSKNETVAYVKDVVLRGRAVEGP